MLAFNIARPVRLVIAEDHAILRSGLAVLLEAEDDLCVVGMACNGQEAIRTANELNPDLLLIDISMPLMNGTEALRQIKQRHPRIKILVLTMHKSEEYVRMAMGSGADGYVLKDDSREELIGAIHHVMKGNKYLSPEISSAVVSAYLNGTPGAASTWSQLTPRERQTLKLIAEGLKNREIADFLSVSVKTVEKHRSNLMRKLDLHSSSAVTAYAIETGFVSR